MEFDALGGTYVSKYIDFNSQRCINWYPNPAVKQEKSSSKLSLFPTPGLTEFVTIAEDNKGKGIYTVRDLTGIERCFTVVGQHLYEIFLDRSYIQRGQFSQVINSTQKWYFRSDIDNHLVIIGDNWGYVYDLSTNELEEITDGDFAGGNTLDYVDGYFVTTPSTPLTQGRVRFSAIEDPYTWPITSVFTPSTKSDRTLRVIAWREELYCFGEETIEVYLNDGSSPWSRRKGVTQSVGLLAKHACDLTHMGIIFLGKTDKGRPMAFLYQTDYSVKPIMPPAISWFIGKNPTNENCSSFLQYTKDGHILWHLHVPESKTTFVYDLLTDLWFERRSYLPYMNSDGTRDLSMYRPIECCMFNGINLFCDPYTGTIWKEDYKVHTEDGLMIRREFTSPILSQEECNIALHNVELVTNKGNGPGNIQIEYSRDGGHTFRVGRLIRLQESQHFLNRNKITKLGTARRWVVRVAVTDPIDLAVISVLANGSQGGAR